MPVLRFIGDGNHEVPGVPLRDLEADDIERLARERTGAPTLGDPTPEAVVVDLLSSGLYAEPAPSRSSKTATPVASAKEG